MSIYRAEDPSTSRGGAADVELRAGTQKRLLLAEFAAAPRDGYTADEVGRAAGLLHTGYWKRVSDLKRDGLIAPLRRDGKPVTRLGRSGSLQSVLVITPRGVAALRRP